MSWLILIGSGLLEAGWATMLPRTQGFSRLGPSVAFVALLALSMYGLSVATRDIPIGPAYAVWVGIGAFGTLVADVVLNDQRMTAPQLLAVLALVASIVAVRVTSSS